MNDNQLNPQWWDSSLESTKCDLSKAIKEDDYDTVTVPILAEDTQHRAKNHLANSSSVVFAEKYLKVKLSITATQVSYYNFYLSWF